MGTTVAVAGASGYAGGELLRLLAGHPELELGRGDRARQRRRSRLGVGAPAPGRPGRPDASAPTDPAALAEADLVFLALPHGAVGRGRRASCRPTVRVVDLGADHRLRDPPAWAAYYGGAHAGAWTYGLPELPGQRAPIAAGDPGRRHRLLRGGHDPGPGAADRRRAGRARTTWWSSPPPAPPAPAARSRPHLLGSEVMGDAVAPTRSARHQHTPEIKQATGATHRCRSRRCWRRCRAASWPPSPRAGRPGRDRAGRPRRCCASAYADEPFVHVLPEGTWPQHRGHARHERRATCRPRSTPTPAG